MATQLAITASETSNNFTELTFKRPSGFWSSLTGLRRVNIITGHSLKIFRYSLLHSFQRKYLQRAWKFEDLKGCEAGTLVCQTVAARLLCGLVTDETCNVVKLSHSE